MTTLFTYTLLNGSIFESNTDISNNKRMLKLAMQSRNHSKNTKSYTKKNKNTKHEFNHIYQNKDMNHFKRNKRSHN